MDSIPPNERDVIIDIDSCTEEVGTSALSDGNKVSFTVSENPASLTNNQKNIDELSPEIVKNNKREKRKTTSAKKPCKPPRPPRGVSLDAADQKLIKEIAELAMIKRARIERMKALKKMKAAKASSASASSSGNLIAMLFTVIFCLVVIFQGIFLILPYLETIDHIFCNFPQFSDHVLLLGCHSSGIFPRNKSVVHIPGSMEASAMVEVNLSPSGVPLTNIESPMYVNITLCVEIINLIVMLVLLCFLRK